LQKLAQPLTLREKIFELHDAVRVLQQHSPDRDQNSRFEHLENQVSLIKKAVGTLADAVSDEFESLKRDQSPAKRVQDLELDITDVKSKLKEGIATVKSDFKGLFEHLRQITQNLNHQTLQNAHQIERLCVQGPRIEAEQTCAPMLERLAALEKSLGDQTLTVQSLASQNLAPRLHSLEERVGAVTAKLDTNPKDSEPSEIMKDWISRKTTALSARIDRFDALRQAQEKAVDQRFMMLQDLQETQRKEVF